ncbi:MAG: TIGR02757 family protein [Alphaproteobacteria bacterium]|nr:TIGR02757 family protein [Alphaproteobacteria bacterium]
MPPSPLHVYLDALVAHTDGATRRLRDPVRFVHRYADPRDAEIAGLLAAGFAYGRVDLFLPVLERLFDALDAGGGPRAFVDGFTPEHAAPFLDLVYRWTRGDDVALLLAGLRVVLAEHGTLEALFAGAGPVRDRLQRAVDTLRAGCLTAAQAQGRGLASPDDLPRGLRYLLASPATGSACKRWHLFLRWMVRPPGDGVDLGLWTVMAPAELLVPVDVHVGRVARFLGLTQRPDASWRTAEEVTASLRAFDAADPVRYDFALAHLGISGACRGHRDAGICPACPLDPVCRAPAKRPTSRRSGR